MSHHAIDSIAAATGFNYLTLLYTSLTFKNAPFLSVLLSLKSGAIEADHRYHPDLPRNRQ